MAHTEDECFARFRATGETEALGEVADLVGPELLRVALHLTGHPTDAEDLLQETLLVAMERADSWDAERPLRPWLLGILTNRARLARQQRARTPDPERLERTPPGRPEAHLLEMELTEDVEAAILKLPAASQPVLVLRLKHHLAVAEIADALRRPPGTVRSQLQRGLEQLRRLLPASYAGALVAWIDRPARGMDAVREAVIAHASTHASAPIPASFTSLSLLGALTMKHLAATAVALVGITGIALIGLQRPSREGAVPAPVLPARAPGVELSVPERVTERATVTTETPARVPREVTQVPVPTPSTFGTLLIRVRHGGPDSTDPRPAAGYIAAVAAEGVGRAFPDPKVVFTDENGEARLGRIAAGRVSVSLLRGTHDEVEIVAGETAVLELRAWAGITANVRVVDDRGEPVGGAELWVSQRFHSNRGHVIAVTGADGRGTIPSLTRNHYIAARAAGFASSLLAPIVGEPGSQHPVELVLDRPGCALSGRVFDAAGAPVDGALVFLGPESPTRSQRAPDGSTRRGPPLQRTHTDATGYFHLDFLDPGAVDILVRADGHAPLRDVIQVDEHRVREIALLLVPETRVTGRVTARDGNPIAGVQIATLPLEGLAGTMAYSDVAGIFELEGLCAGRTQLLAKHAAHGSATVELVLTHGAEPVWNPVLDPVPSLRGIVIDAYDQPLAEWSVVLTIPGDPDVRLRSNTDEQGRFTITDLEQRSYRLWVQEHAGWQLFPRLIEEDVVPPGPITLKVPDIATSASTIVGEVVHADGSPATEGKLTLWHNERRLWREYPILDDGTLQVTGVPPGTLHLEIHASDAPWMLLGEHDVVVGEVLDLGRLTLLDGGRIAGEIDAPEEALESLVFLLIAEDGGAHGREGGVVMLTGSSFRSALVAPGRYSLDVQGTGVAPVSASFSIAPGKTLRHDLHFVRAPTRSAVFELPEGAPTPRRLWCELRTPDGRRAWMNGNVPREGRSIIADISVPAGSYRLTAESNNGLRAEGIFTIASEGHEEARSFRLIRH